MSYLTYGLDHSQKQYSTTNLLMCVCFFLKYGSSDGHVSLSVVCSWSTQNEFLCLILIFVVLREIS